MEIVFRQTLPYISCKIPRSLHQVLILLVICCLCDASDAPGAACQDRHDAGLDCLEEMDHHTLLLQTSVKKAQKPAKPRTDEEQILFQTKMKPPERQATSLSFFSSNYSRASRDAVQYIGSRKKPSDPDSVATIGTRLLVAGFAVMGTCVAGWLLVHLAQADMATDKKASAMSVSSFETAEPTAELPLRAKVWNLLEAKTPAGKSYQSVMWILIIGTILSFMIGSTLDREFNVDSTGNYVGPAFNKNIDTLFFGMGEELAGTCIFEIFVVAVFSADYILRLWSVAEEPEYNNSRVQYFFSFYALVDLVSIVPFYVEIATPYTDLPASQFLRTLRLLRMVRMEGRYTEAFTLFDDVLAENTHLLATASFVGFVTWTIFAGLYYIAERRNNDMIYCPACPDVDVAKCSIDTWGFASCAKAGCNSECWNLFESIPSSMYFTLVNLFGEFPLTDRQSNWGKVVATTVAVVAVLLFGIPTGIVGNGFDTILKRRKAAREQSTTPGEEQPAAIEAAVRGSDTFRGKVYDFIEGKTPAGVLCDWFIISLIVLTTITYFLETMQGFMDSHPDLFHFLEVFEFVTVIIFTAEYITRAYAMPEDPRYAGWSGWFSWVIGFDSVVDLLSILPYWFALAFTPGTQATTFVRFLRLIRMFKTKTFQDNFKVMASVVRAQADVFIITAYAASILWVLFSALMYLSERDNPDEEVRSYYKTVPDAMWITMLNLSGECPLAFYSIFGKVLLGIIGIFAVGFVAIPIGILGAGFQDYVEDSYEDEATPTGQDSASFGDAAEGSIRPGSEDTVQKNVEDFIEGRTYPGQVFEILVLVLIFVTIFIAILTTVPSMDCDIVNSNWCDLFMIVEAFATLVFTVEYLLRLFAAPSRLEYIFSFYSLVDLLAIVPWYVVLFFPSGWVAQNDSVFKMFRILRLFKLDKFCPSLTLIDDVFRLKRTALFVTGVIAIILWTLFGSLLYIAEHQDTINAIDNMPQQGCMVNCTESVRFNNAFAAMPFTMIHLTGDFPIIEYTWAARLICMVIVIVGVGIVGIPSGIIADGFVQVVSEKTKIGSEKRSAMREYDIAFAALGNTPAPREFESNKLDSLQVDCNAFLNGQKGPKGGVQRSFPSKCFNNLVFALIIANVVCALIESEPAVSKGPQYFFRAFEAFTVMIFTIEYLMRLLSVTKDKKHLYSRWCYVTTFFGVVDLLAIAPWYIQQLYTYMVDAELSQDTIAVFRMFRLFRLLELEHFVTAFTVLDNVFVRSKGVFIASGLMALAIWVSSAALFFLFEGDNPNWCEEWSKPGCALKLTPDCVCTSKTAFSSMPDCLYYVAIFLVGEWAVVDFTLPGKFLCLALCLVGIAIYAVPVGTLFDSFGAVLEDGLDALDEEEDD